MNLADFRNVVKASRTRQDLILEAKGRDYTIGDKDRLRNFKDVATMSSAAPLTVWFVYLMKHIFAIASFVAHGSVASEELRGRFDDAHNYLYLGEALVDDAAK